MPYSIFYRCIYSANPDQSVAINPETFTVKENMAEMVKLLRMTKGYKQSISDFYDQLKLQADKCGIKNPDTMVRDRLIQAITEEAVLEEVMRLDKPTAEEVFQKYTQIVKVSQELTLETFNAILITVYCIFYIPGMCGDAKS